MYKLHKLLIIILWFSLLLPGHAMLPGNLSSAPVQAREEGTNVFSRKFNLRAMGSFDFGSTHFMPFWPEKLDTEHADGAFPASGYGLGGLIDYRVSPHLVVFSGITFHKWRFRMGEPGSRSAGDWILEQTNQLTRYTDPWTQDVFFKMSAYDFRAGMRYIRTLSMNTESWIGAGAAITPWSAIVSASDQIGNFGKTTGSANDFFIQAGFNFKIYPVRGNESSGIILSPFLEAGFARARKLKMDNLYMNGWNWDNPKGEPAILPFRLGMEITLF